MKRILIHGLIALTIQVIFSGTLQAFPVIPYVGVEGIKFSEKAEVKGNENKFIFPKAAETLRRKSISPEVKIPAQKKT